MVKTLACIAIVFIVVFPPYVAWLALIEPLVRVIGARDWEPIESKSLEVDRRDIRKGRAITEVHYTFEYEGSNFTGDTLTFWRGSDSGKIHPIVANQQNVKLWIDPQDPSNSTIIKGIEWKNLIFGLIPLFFCYFSAGILWAVVIGIIDKIKKAEQGGDGDAEEAV